MTYKGLPVYNISIDEDVESLGLKCNSLVTNPAVCVDYLRFAEEEPKRLIFAQEQNEKHIITGVSLLADSPIYRCDYFGGYYVVFTKDTIRQLVEKYSKDGYNNVCSLQHDGTVVEDVILIESYFIDKERGICPKEFEDIPDGSWITTYKVNNEDVWQECKNGNCNGFSVEIDANLIPTPEDQHIEEERLSDEDEYEEMDWLEELLAWLESDDDIEVLFASSKKVAEVIDQSIDDVQELKIRTKSGKTVTGYVYTTWTVQGSLNMAVWDGSEWHIINETNIKSVEPTINKNSVNWIEAVDNKEWTNIIKIINNPDNENITKVVTAPKNDIEDAILNHYIVEIKYDDPTDEPCKNFRQCLVAEYGYTTANNACLRVYEYMGATHTSDNLPGWRNMLLSRITAFKINKILEPINQAPEGFNPYADKDGFVALLKAQW